MNLKEVVEATKRNEEIYENSADALLQMIPASSDSWSITVMCLAGASLLTSLALAVGLYRFVRKLKAMSILILALQNAEGFPVNTVPQQFISVTTPVTETKTMAANILYSAQIPLFMSPFTILIIIAVILLTYCIFRKRRSLTLITIEITIGQDCVEIPMQELCLCPSYWHFRGSQYIDNVDVIGTLIPKVDVIDKSASNIKRAARFCNLVILFC